MRAFRDAVMHAAHRHDARRRTRPIGSAPSAAATSPRRSFRRSTSSSARTTRRAAIRRSVASSSDMLTTYVGRPSPLSDAPRLSRARRRAGLAQARGPESHRRPQDQQHRGPGAARAAHGQAPHHRRDGRGAARRRDGDGVRALRPGVRRVHGRGGHAAPGAQRLPHAAHGREGGSGDERNAHAQGRDDARRSATGSRTSTTRTTSSARSSGPAPYPRMVRDFQSVIGREARAQMLERAGRLPQHGRRVRRRRIERDGGLSRVRRRSRTVELVGVEAAGEGLDTEHHSASLSRGTPGVLHGALSYLLQDEPGRCIRRTRSPPGLDYPGVGPEHAYLKDIGRATYVAVTDDEALEGFQLLSRLEGIIPALETAHAVSWIASQARPVDAPTTPCSCASAVAATRTWRRSAKWVSCAVTASPVPPRRRGTERPAKPPFLAGSGRGAAPALRQGGARAPALPAEQPDLQGRDRHAARRLRAASGRRPTSWCSRSPRARSTGTTHVVLSTSASKVGGQPRLAVLQGRRSRADACCKGFEERKSSRCSASSSARGRRRPTRTTC